jgi:hypothetical protein
MAAVAIAGIGMMMVCSSSLAAVMLMGGEEETPTTTTSAQSAAGPTGDEDDDTGDEDDDTGDEDDDTGDDDSGATTPTPAPAVEYHWEVENFKEITTGQPFKTINNASVNNCRNKCEKKNKCVGFSIGPQTGTKRCILYSGDVSTTLDMSKNTHLLSRV